MASDPKQDKKEFQDEDQDPDNIEYVTHVERKMSKLFKENSNNLGKIIENEITQMVVYITNMMPTENYKDFSSEASLPFIFDQCGYTIQQIFQIFAIMVAAVRKSKNDKLIKDLEFYRDIVNDPRGDLVNEFMTIYKYFNILGKYKSTHEIYSLGDSLDKLNLIWNHNNDKKIIQIPFSDSMYDKQEKKEGEESINIKINEGRKKIIIDNYDNLLQRGKIHNIVMYFID
jgi:hypothetical protein